MNDVLMTPDTCMQFLVWSYYYHEIIPEREKSYAFYQKFSDYDVTKLDEIKELLFKCFEEQSVYNACMQFQKAKQMNVPCPYSQQALDNMFACEC